MVNVSGGSTAHRSARFPWLVLLTALTALAVLFTAVPGAKAAPLPVPAVPAASGAATVGQFVQAVTEETTPNGDQVISLDIAQSYDHDVLQAAVADINAEGVNTFVQGQLQVANVPGPNAPPQDVDVSGTAAVTASGVQFTIHPSDSVTINAAYWVQAAATAVGIVVYLAVRSVCIATLTLSVAGLPAAVVCASTGGFVGSVTRSFILMAADNTFADPKEWGYALMNAIFAAVSAGAWDAGVKAWATDTLPGLIKGLVEGVKAIATSVMRWWRTMGEFISAGGNTLGELARYLPEAARNVRSTSSHAAPAGFQLRIMPVGDSITEGFNSTTGNGYRRALEQREVDRGFLVDYVGSHRSGSMAQASNEGWSSQEISFIQDKTMAHVKEYSPNVVTLLAGTNDVGRGNQAGAARRLVSLVQQIRAAVPDALIVVGGLLPDVDPTTASAHRRFNFQVQESFTPRDIAHVRFVSFDDIDPRNEMNGLHPNDAGYAKMATVWGPAIEDLLHNGLVGERGRFSDASAGLTNCIDRNTWYDHGTITLGNGHIGEQVRLADLNGDGRDDYLTVNDNGSVDAYVNGGGKPNDWIWYNYGRIAGGVGAPGEEVIFADINGDGRDDYLTVTDEGATRLWINGGGQPDNWIWYDQGEIAAGVRNIRPPIYENPATPPRTNFDSLTFADLNGDRRDDYIIVNAETGSAEAWLMVGDAFHPTLMPQGVVAWGVGGRGGPPEFGRMDCDHREEYLRVTGSPGGAVTGYRNDGPSPTGGWSWAGPLDIASGAAPAKSTVVFADMNGDGRDDYVAVGLQGELTNVYLRG